MQVQIVYIDKNCSNFLKVYDATYVTVRTATAIHSLCIWIYSL